LTDQICRQVHECTNGPKCGIPHSLTSRRAFREGASKRWSRSLHRRWERRRRIPVAWSAPSRPGAPRGTGAVGAGGRRHHSFGSYHAPANAEPGSASSSSYSQIGWFDRPEGRNRMGQVDNVLGAAKAAPPVEECQCGLAETQ
jgi:hypothetical protein